MRIVLSKCYGGFGLSEKARNLIGEDVDIYAHEFRTNPLLICAVETLGEEANSSFSNLCIVDIPEEATDWELNEYDGFEEIIYVVDGKIYHA